MGNQQDLIARLDLVTSNEKSSWLKDAEYRKENKGWLKKSQLTGIKILLALREQNLTQKELAEKLNVSAQQVNKWVKGTENFTFETIDKIERILNIRIINIEGEIEYEQMTATIRRKQEYSEARYSVSHYQQAESKRYGVDATVSVFSHLQIAQYTTVLEAA